MTKLTNVKALEMVLLIEEVKNNDTLAKKLLSMKTQFEKKNNGGKEGDKKLTKAQQENEVIKEQILSVLTTTPTAIKELQAKNVEIGVDKYSNQKISALLRQLLKDGLVVRTEEKRVALFSIVEEVEAEEIEPVVVEEVPQEEEVVEPVVEQEEINSSEPMTDEEEQAILDIIEG